ncbi:phage transcriptional repressor [Streptococcus pneumoniae]|uniref:Phage transcriptional repressor n=1 Tax=Streptococcus pneumoniae TaxID=1313 RepID=A0AAQ3A1G6_STREE|nr:phage transcriptional repressor [Streptococcus pneumoniae]CZD32880.1 phage transcriptional repressor [Streptococcus pneumoniae]CZE32317.1 phage transcriptional repressor [Streptococcus pneumoniae]VIP27367.1 phage transcriptional repressor [Streptococcus pneumoniae]VIP90441.1 phage transcriptional repressor [Streptococcus pneumoniae]
MARGRGKLTPQDKEDMKVFSTNLNAILSDRNCKQVELSRATGIPASTLTGYVKGTSLPIPGNVQKIADYFGVLKSTLDPRFVSEDSAIEVTPTPFPIASPIQTIYDELKPPRQAKVLNYAKRQLDEQKNEEETKINEVSEVISLYQVEVVSETAAASGFNYGFGYDDTDRETIEVDEQPPRHDIATKVSGDSMQPDYQDGDILYLVDKGLTTYNGDLAVIAYGDRSYFKKIYTENGRLRLVSLNDKYEDIILDFPPAEDTHIKIYAVVSVYRGE